MIIMGYQGIGKSTLCKEREYAIDLESSCFRVGNKRPDNWEVYYVNVAKDLSDQGFTVFISSHKEIRTELIEREIPFAAIVPSLDLKKEWTDRLWSRYVISKKDKDYRAYLNTKACYSKNIEDIINQVSIVKKNLVYTISDMNYSLEEIVDDIYRRM